MPDTEGRSRRSTAIVTLTSPIFLAAVLLLLLNDWVLKPAVGNWLTGKLSDVAGLGAFAMFWAALFPRQRRLVFVLIGLGFLVWKSPLSEAPLRAWNALGVWKLGRVVDYSDWLVLSVLAPAYWLVRRMDRERPRAGEVARRIRAVAAAATAIVAFSATSVGRPTPVAGGAYTVRATRDEVRAGLDSIHVSVSRKRQNAANVADTVTVNIRQPPERWVTVIFEVREAQPDESEIHLLGMSAQGPAPSNESLHRAFSAQVVQPLQEWAARHHNESIR